ncbi:MAG TPA: SRPBCC domain-containing protein, partial [Thermoanaerobaculia bacterium]|nr:SRPBCC domain-containing protein [Thermoanaerobaculia bacterium]
MTRTFDAPPEVVWRAWTERDQVAAWWCPHHFTNVRCEIDVRPGGTIRIDMQGPDGTIYPMSGVYHELIEPERIVMTTQAMHDAEGNPQFEILNTVTFERDGAKTKLTMRAVVVYSTEAAKFALAGMREGWAQSLDKLADAAARAMDAETFTISRLFDAPRELVFAVWTEREHLNAWWGPRGFTVIKCENDLRDGGRMHFGLQAPDGSVMWGRWMYREVLKPERLVFVSSFSDEDG